MIEKNFYNEFFEKSMEEISKKTGADVSEDSFTRIVNQVLLKGSETSLEELSRNVKRLSTENLIDSDLDRFYDGFFGIKRQSLDTSSYKKVTIVNNYDKDLFIELGTVFKINNFYFSALENFIIEKNSNFEISVTPDFTIITRPNMIPISSSVSLEMKQEYLEFAGKIFAIHVADSLEESDASYKARCQKLTQNFGFDNLAKIRSICIGIEELQDIKVELKPYSTEIVVIPKKIDRVDAVVKYVREIVGFYQGSKITVSTPSITFLMIDGLGSQLKKELLNTTELSNINFHMKNIYERVESYCKSIMIDEKEENRYSPKKVELIINRYFVDNNLPVILDENSIRHFYSIYNRSDYSTEMSGAEIKRSSDKIIMSDIITLKELS